MLAVKDLVVGYGSMTAVHGVTFKIETGEIICIVGPNGAGKSSTLLAIAGAVRARFGSVALRGEAIDRATPEAIVRAGLALVPEGRRIFMSLTVRENLGIPIRLRSDRAAARADLEMLLDMFPILKTRLDGAAGKLSGGEQQQLAIARALLCGPRILLVDEPSLGLAPRVIEGVYAALLELNRTRGLTLLIVEQSVERAARYSTRYLVMRNGSIVRAGLTSRGDVGAMQQAYFGYHDGAAA